MRKIIEVFRLYSSGLGAVPPYHSSPLSKLKNSVRLIVFELNDYVQLLNVLLQFLDYLKN